MKLGKPGSTVKTRIEHISFECNGEYMDVEAHDGYVDISIGGVENIKLAVSLEEWQEISSRITQMLKQG